jgi:glycosyltransferase involved in cell wall biosynthesis
VNSKVSIFIPFHNPDHRLSFAIESVINQTYKNWELYLINDGSKNEYNKYLNFQEDPRVKLISFDDCAGLAARLNLMSTIGDGEYIARMDADDYMSPDRIEQQIKLKPDDQTVITSSANIVINGKVISYFRGSSYEINSISTFTPIRIIHPTVFARRQWFKNHLYDTDLKRAQDRDLWLRATSDTRFINIDLPLLNYNKSNLNSIYKIYINYFYLSKVLYRKSSNPFVFVYCFILFISRILFRFIL